MAGFDGLPNFLDELVVHADVGQRAAQGTAQGTNGQAQPGHPEDEADQHAPEGTAQRARAHQADGLLDLDLAIRLADDDGGIFQLDDFLLLQLHQVITQLLGTGFGVKSQYH